VTIETVRAICRSLPAVSEDLKWGSDLCFLVAKKMFVVVNLEPPHQIAFKCTPEMFGELIERPGIIPAPYMARNMWVMEETLGATLARDELEGLVRASYDLVVAKLPRSKQPGAAQSNRSRGTASTRSVKTTSKPPRGTSTQSNAAKPRTSARLTTSTRSRRARQR